MNSGLKLKIKKMLLKLVGIIIVLLLIWAVLYFLTKIFQINTQQKELTYEEKIKLKHDTAIFNGSIDEEDKDKFSNYIDEYFNYCNSKEYDKAYSMIYDDCKTKFYPTIDKFKELIDVKFDKLKMYEYQNISNVDNMYVYRILLFDDVSAYGTYDSPTKNASYIAIIKGDNDNLKISLNGFVKTESLGYKYNVNNVDITIVSKDIFYDHVDYYLEFDNKNDKYVLFNYLDAILVINKESEKVAYNNRENDAKFLTVNIRSKREIKLSFNKSFDTVKYNDLMINMPKIYILEEDIFTKVINREITVEQLANTATSSNVDLSL